MIQIDINMPIGCIYEGDNGKTEYCPLCNHDDVPYCQYLDDDEAALGIDERPCYCPLYKTESQWIPVSERLPDIKENHVSEPCIVYCENGAYGFTELEENIFGQVGWYCEREDEFHESLGKVLAWMPLPEPWGGDSDG